MKKIVLGSAVVLMSISALKAQTVSTFENILTKKDTFWNGSDLSGGKANGAAFYHNSYNSRWSSWSGVAVSSETDTNTVSWSNQYASRSGKGVNGSQSYGVVYSRALVSFTNSANGDSILGVSVNNSTYAAKTIANGDAFSKKFGGATGNDPDLFSVIFYGFDKNDDLTDSVEFVLADYRFSDNSKDYIVADWNWVDLTKLGRVAYMAIGFKSTDAGQWGINTPTYACIDSLVYKNSQPNFNPIAAVHRYELGYNSPVKNYNLTKSNLNPGSYRDSLEVAILNVVSNGTAQVVSDSVISYKPNKDFNGIDTILYASCNEFGLCDTGVVLITVNDKPIAKDDTFKGGENGFLEFDILANDWDERSANLRVSLLDTAKHGKASILSTNKLEYISDTDFKGKDTCSYIICDAFGKCDTAQVFLTIENEVGIAQHTLNTVTVYPNPAHDVIYVAGAQKVYARLMALNGHIIFAGEIENTLNVSAYPKGVYLLNLSKDGETSHHRIVLQ